MEFKVQQCMYGHLFLKVCFVHLCFFPMEMMESSLLLHHERLQQDRSGCFRLEKEYAYLNHDESQARYEEKREINRQHFGARTARNPAPMNSVNRWAHHYRSTIFSSLRCGTQHLEGEIDFGSYSERHQNSEVSIHWLATISNYHTRTRNILSMESMLRPGWDFIWTTLPTKVRSPNTVGLNGTHSIQDNPLTKSSQSET